MTAIYKIQPRHLNEHASLYGGQLLEWIDNYCFAKTEKYKKEAGERFVTRATNCEFLHPIYLGDAITIKMKNEKIGNTSITFDYEVIVKDKIVAKGSSTFVKLFEDKPTSILEDKEETIKWKEKQLTEREDTSKKP